MGRIYEALYGQQAPAETGPSVADAGSLGHSGLGAGNLPPGSLPPGYEQALFTALEGDFKQHKVWSRQLRKTAIALDELAPQQPGLGSLVMLSGAASHAGTTTVAKNLSHTVSLVRPRSRTLLLDFNPRNRDKNRALTADLMRALSFWSAEQLLANLPAGDVLLVDVGLDDEACKSLGVDDALQQFIDLARAHFDTLFFDTPEFNRYPVCDSLGRIADGVVLVVPCQRARIPALNASQTDMEQLGINLLGVILNYRQYPLPRWLMRFI